MKQHQEKGVPLSVQPCFCCSELCCVGVCVTSDYTCIQDKTKDHLYTQPLLGLIINSLQHYKPYNISAHND